MTVLLLNDPIGSEPMINVQIDPAWFVLSLSQQAALHMVNTWSTLPSNILKLPHFHGLHVSLCSNLSHAQNILNCLVSVFRSLQVAASPVFSGAGLVKSPLRSLGRKIPISPLLCCKNRTLQEHKSTKAITIVNKVPQNPVEYYVSIKHWEKPW